MYRLNAYIISILMFCLLPVGGWAQTPDTQRPEPLTIIEHISSTEGHSVTMPEALKLRMIPRTHQAATTASTAVSGGYRIQVFSDSNPRAQGEARGKASDISSKYPQWRTYVTYDAPYWRLRIGDFTNYEDANDALSALKEAFPSYKRELRIVRDHINTPN